MEWSDENVLGCIFVNYDNVISPEELSMELKGPKV